MIDSQSNFKAVIWSTNSGYCFNISSAQTCISFTNKGIVSPMDIIVLASSGATTKITIIITPTIVKIEINKLTILFSFFTAFLSLSLHLKIYISIALIGTFNMNAIHPPIIKGVANLIPV